MIGFGPSLHGFMPHGMCYLWRPEILWLHVGSDAVVALSYFSIPGALLIFAARRPDLTYRPIIWLFVAFIVLCGITHLLSIWTVWTPDYFVEGLFKAATALASAATAIALWPLLPRALALPSTANLAQANTDLRAEIERRRGAEAELVGFASELEARVEARTADLERANAALHQFAGAASHDLRAPLRHITVFAQILERDEPAMSPAGRETLGRILTSTERMRALIDALLEYARLVNTPPRRQALDLAALVQRVLEARAPEIEAVRANVQVGALPGAIGDPGLIERVLDNLVANALKYAGDAPRIEITGRTCEDGGVQYAVTDTGPGVPPDQAVSIFDMLHRLPEAASQDGAGMGLAFCRTMVESHGGRLWLDTGHDCGARFVFTLPGGEPRPVQDLRSVQ